MTIPDAVLLEAWEWGIPRSPIERSLAFLAAAWPDRPLDELARLPVGRRNRLLLELRLALFGPQLELQTACPRCAEPLEMQIPISLLAARGEAPEADPDTGHTLETDGLAIHFRLPDSLDLLEAAAASEPRKLLLERCVTGIEATTPAGALPAAGKGSPVALPPETEAQLGEAMRLLDPLADASFALTCPACAETWATPFDIGGSLWIEIDAWAYRTLREIHWLASAYGWSEADILALGSWRRQAYLQMNNYA